MADDPDASDTARTQTVSGPDPTLAESDRRERIAAIIRNGLSNGPISQSEAAWAHLQTRLGDIVDALLKEI